MTMLIPGMWVRAVQFRAKTVSLAGVQMKSGAEATETVGIVTQIRGDRPVNPTKVGVWIAPDGGGDEVAVPLESIVEAKNL